jgi:uncharacterized protein (DUF2141 family)
MTISKWVRIAAALFAVVALVGCGGDDDPAGPGVTTGIAGTVTVQPGSPANPTNARAAVYSSLADFGNDAWVKQAAVTQSGSVWTFSIELNAGTYYIDVWKDNDNSGTITVGDIYGYYTTGQGGAPAPVMVAQGQMTPVTMMVAVAVAP